MSETPIEDYALLSDCHTSALVSRDGSVDWLCFPRFDAPSVFGRILDDEAGHWQIRPGGAYRVTGRRYLDRTLVLETTFHTDQGVLVLRDALATGPNPDGHSLGARAPHALMRVARCTEGEVELVNCYAPRPEYGLIHPLLHPVEGGVGGYGGASVLCLAGPGWMAVERATARATLRLEAGDEVAYALCHRTTSEPSPDAWDPEEIRRRMDETEEAWRTWSELHQAYEGPWREEVRHSGRVLQGLTYQPTGAIVAAPTTSLPETVGGARNWDYRYTWIRDASFTLEALWVAACPDNAYRFFDFLARTALLQVRVGGELQIMFGIGGEHDLTERELPHLSGWRGSRPVRIGNGAWDQRQLDIYGELLGAAHRLREYVNFGPPTGEFLCALADAAADGWERTDRGIWEVRGPPRHFLYSKLMCWSALDRALELQKELGAGQERVERWRRVGARIRRAILERGWDEGAGAFTQAFGRPELDASALMIPIVGFLPAGDERVLSTLRAVEERLTDEAGLVYRYRADDGLEGEEGSFLLCTFWLAECWARAGRVERAREVFERARSYANDVGLLSEEVDSERGALLGNFPQAFSHIGLVNAAWAIRRAEAGDEEELGGLPGGRMDTEA